MKMTAAEQVSLTSFLNAFFRENPAKFVRHDNKIFIKYYLKPFDFELRIPLKYYSYTGRHQFNFPVELMVGENAEKNNVHPWTLIGLLLQDLSARHSKAQSGHRNFLQRFYNSCENLQTILTKLTAANIAEIFSHSVDFQLTENGLLSGHQLHPSPKSREGFTAAEFDKYSPELQNNFKLHYFIAHPEIVFTQSALTYDANELVRKYFLAKPVAQDGIVIPMHPWQAEYVKRLPALNSLLKRGLLTDLGLLGNEFTATSSVRTLYSRNCPFMAKFSLNIAITNSVRMQYVKELTRGIAAHRFWQGSIGNKICQQYPQFIPITDPAFLCLRDGDTFIEETAALFRVNLFTDINNNTTSLATLCQDHPFNSGNRFKQLITLVAELQNTTPKNAAVLWFEEFLKVALEPLLWMFVHYGIAVEAHQQNLLIELSNGLPIKSYYRDNQGYYLVDKAFDTLAIQVDPKILNEFCSGTKEFISHHFIYYLICNSTFGVINALGTSGMIEEEILMQSLTKFIHLKHKTWQASNYLLPQLLTLSSLPFKGNLLTRLYELDELTAPLEQQSIYLDISNPIKLAYAKMEPLYVR